MKILFVSTLYAPFNIGGAEATVRLLAQAARDSGDEAVVVTLAPTRGDVGEGRIDGTRIIYVPLRNVYFPTAARGRSGAAKLAWHLIDSFNPLMAGIVGEVLEREKPDVVSLHNIQGFSASLWWMLSRRGVPTVQTLHDYYAGCANSTMYREGRNCARPCLQCRVFALPRRRLSGRVDGVTAVSRRQLTRLEKAGVFGGVDDKRIIQGCNKDADAPPPGRGERGGRGGRPLRVGMLGRLDPIKGIDWALGVLGRFAADEVSVSVAGRGEPEYEAVLRASFASPQIAFEGQVEPRSWFASIDLLLLPSLWEEPMGRVIHEALECGVPILGAAIGGIPETVEDGVTGFLFEPADDESLRAALRRLLDAPPDWVALAARCRHAAERFRLATIYEQYRAAWGDAVRRRAVAGGA